MWDKVLGPVADKRTESGTLKLFPVYLKGEDLFGLTVPAVAKITESVRSFFAVLLKDFETQLDNPYSRLRFVCVIPAPRSGGL